MVGNLIHSPFLSWRISAVQPKAPAGKGWQILVFLSTLTPVKNNCSHSGRGVLSGSISTETPVFQPAERSVFGAWVDLRKGPNFGTSFSIEINPGVAVFVPRGVANGYQTLEDNVTYTYLVNAHWSPEAQYTFVHLFDPDIAINWPIGENEAIVSEKDTNHPVLKDVIPMEV